MRTNHDVQVFADAHKAWRVLLEDLASAQTSILIELYMLVDDAVDQAFVDALVEIGRAHV